MTSTDKNQKAVSNKPYSINHAKTLENYVDCSRKRQKNRSIMSADNYDRLKQDEESTNVFSYNYLPNSAQNKSYMNKSFGDQNNNDKLQKEQIFFVEEKQRAQDQGRKILNEVAVLKEKEQQLMSVKNRTAQLKKKIQQETFYIKKQDNLIKKIKNDQKMFCQKKHNLSLNNRENKSEYNSKREQFFKMREDHKKTLIEHQQSILRAKKENQEKEKQTAANLSNLKRQIDNEQETNNREKSAAIKNVHTQQQNAKQKKESQLKDQLNIKYTQRLTNKTEYTNRLNTEIDSIEIYEKALLEEQHKTLSKKTNREMKIKEINENFKSGEFSIQNKQKTDSDLDLSL